MSVLIAMETSPMQCGLLATATNDNKICPLFFLKERASSSSGAECLQVDKSSAPFVLPYKEITKDEANTCVIYFFSSVGNGFHVLWFFFAAAVF